MKSLYESILDDDDVLINGTKEYLDNPLIELYCIYKETKNFKQDITKVSQIADRIVNELKLSKYNVKVREDGIFIYKQNPKYNSKLEQNGIYNPRYLIFVIRFDRDDYIVRRGAKCVMVDVGAGKLKQFVKAMDEFSKKYNVEKSPLGYRYILW